MQNIAKTALIIATAFLACKLQNCWLLCFWFMVMVNWEG